MLIVILRVFVLYVFTIFIMRIMGKKEIGQMQPFELAITLIVSNLIVLPMENNGVPFWSGIVPALTITCSQLLFSYLTLKNERIQEIMSGKPTVMIKNGKISEKNLREQNYNITELMEQLRLNGIDNYQDVDYAILETNGQLSVLLKPEKRTITLEDMNIKADYCGMQIDVVLDGRIITNNLSKVGMTEKEILNEIEKRNLKQENIFLLSVNAKKQIIIQTKMEE